MENNKENYTQIDYSSKVLQVKNLMTHFKVGSGRNKLKVRAVDDISFDVYKGEVFGLVGESGCGKTTASRTIIRLYRPTGGNVIFEDQIIGSGNDEFFRNLAHSRENYEIEKIKLDSRKYQIYQINEKYKALINELDYELENNSKEYKTAIHEVKKEVENHKKNVFDEKSNFKLQKDNAKFAFITEKTQLFNQTINENLLEITKIKKNMLKALKTKLLALDDSVGIDKEAREAQKVILKGIYEKELAQVVANYDVRITDKASHLLPKNEYNSQVQKLAFEYKNKLVEITKVHEERLAQIVSPDLERIKRDLVKLKQTYDNKKANLVNKKTELTAEMRKEIALVPKTTSVDLEGLKLLKKQHLAYVKEQRGYIRKSKEEHFKIEAAKKAKKMQMIFQDPISSLNPRMTVGEIVAEGLVINGIRDKEYLQERVIEVLKLVGLAPEYISRYPHEFSGGQRQRIGIARALIMNPSFIIADEPISALDVSIRAQVLNLLTELKKVLGLTILFIAHDLSVVKFFCDRIAVMYAGKIVELASNEEIFRNPLHPYTKSLLSAIPQPDPDSEKLRKRISYSPNMHDYRNDRPTLKEVAKDHFVYCNDAEYQTLLKNLGDTNA